MSTPIVSSISGLEIYAPSAGFAPTNSADVSAIASGYQMVSAVGDDGTNITSINSMPLSSQVTVQLPITGSTGDETATYGSSVEFARYDTAGEPDIRTASFDADGIRITYTIDENDYTGMTANEAGLQFEEAGNYYEVTPYTISNWNEVYDHVNSASSTWTASGIDSATCSAIASAYAQSAVSSVSGEYYGTGNVSGFATTAYVDSAVSGVEISFDSSITTASSTAGVTAGVNTAILSGKLDASASSDFYLASNPSGFLTSVDLSNYATTSYVDSAVSGVEISFDSSIATASSTAGITASVNTAILSAYAYESSNSAKLDATAFSTVSANFLTSQTVTALGDDGTYITSINGSALSGQGGGGGASLPITGSVGTDSAMYGETSVEYTRYDTAGEPDIRTASLSPDALDITYTVDENDYYSVRITDSVIEFSDPDGYYDITPYDITTWNSAVETVANNSASWGGGGLVTATASASAIAYTSTSVYESSFTGISSINGSALLARNLLPDAQQASGSAHFHYMPSKTPWGLSEYPGVLAPLQYATGACLAMKQQNNYGAYYKGNEWFISDVGMNTAANGVVRAELHRTRGIHLYGSSLNSATGFHINGSGVDGKSGASAWQYGPTEYNMLTAVNDTVSSNSAAWGGGGGGGGVVTATGSASATAFTGGFPGIKTSYLVSSINGSALLPYGYSSLSANSAGWTSTNSAVSANSAKWTGTNSAVSANSANWNSAYSLISGVTALMDAI